MNTSKESIASQTAKMLLEVEAVHFYDEKPFILTSGKASPVYIDCRKLISYPRLRQTLMDFAAETIYREVGYESIDVVAGGETAGIPFAAWLSDRLMLPMQYIRKKPKGFGRNAQIEGNVIEAARTLLVEDLATDGGSKVGFCNAIRSSGSVVEHCFVVFFYNIFPESSKILSDLGVQLHYLTTWQDVLAVAKASGHFAPKIMSEVESFLAAPVEWSKTHGGV
ncbi:orotate phosphoribosyltransferase [Deferribacterales bacterium]|nr:orotate phosphoribosyltransferase [Deferribacterales bacterium]